MDYYKDIDNTDEIKVIVKEYKLEDVMKDTEDFGEMIGDLVDEHPHIKKLDKVLERMFIYAINRRANN
tara:strand:+ start:743 stop:946 length:204 start_codon:yes stop_codon:yes gene_type:complete